jgi:hypothetical protein
MTVLFVEINRLPMSFIYVYTEDKYSFSFRQKNSYIDIFIKYENQ